MAGTQSLTELANELECDKGTVAGEKHGYTEVYSRLFESYRNREVRLLEIGVDTGKSIELWTRYFSNLQLYGLDFQDRKSFSRSNVQIFQGDQANRADLKRVVDSIKEPLDFIIDDGGHAMDQQQISLGFLFPYLKPGGVYIVEDLHTSLMFPGTTLYGFSLKILPDRSNVTLKVLRNFKDTGKVESIYMLPEEIKYLEDHADACQVVGSKLALLRKKITV